MREDPEAVVVRVAGEVDQHVDAVGADHVGGVPVIQPPTLRQWSSPTRNFSRSVTSSGAATAL